MASLNQPPLEIAMTKLVRIKTLDLSGPALRYAMAGALDLSEELRWAPSSAKDMGGYNLWTDDNGCWAPDVVPDLLVPLVDTYRPWISPPSGDSNTLEETGIPDGWDVEIYNQSTGQMSAAVRGHESWGVALCIAIILIEIGEFVLVPDEFID